MIVRWRDFIPSKLCIIVSLVCQILLIAGLNILSIQFQNLNIKSNREVADRSD